MKYLKEYHKNMFGEYYDKGDYIYGVHYVDHTIPERMKGRKDYDKIEVKGKIVDMKYEIGSKVFTYTVKTFRSDGDRYDFYIVDRHNVKRLLNQDEINDYLFREDIKNYNL